MNTLNIRDRAKLLLRRRQEKAQAVIKRHPLSFMAMAFVVMVFMILDMFDIDYDIHLRINESVRDDSTIDNAIWLPSYALSTQTTIACISKGLSGLSYSPVTKTWFAVTDKPAQIIEINHSGECLQRHRLHGLKDVEAIAWIAEHRFIVAEERRMTLSLIDLAPPVTNDCTDILITPLIGLAAFGEDNNKGFEGLAYIPSSQTVFVVKEAEPMRLLEINGLFSEGKEAIQLYQRNELLPTAPLNRLTLEDISGLHYDIATQHLLLLSDRSRRLTEISLDGQIISSIKFKGGFHGLTEKIRQAEGIAGDGAGTLAIATEPNHLFIFNKVSADSSSSSENEKR